MWDYVEMEQNNTKFDLSKRVLTKQNNDPYAENDIVVEFDATQLNQNNVSNNNIFYFFITRNCFY